MSRPFVVIGGGGHATVVIDLLLDLGAAVEGYAHAAASGEPVCGVPCIGEDADIVARDPETVFLANGLGFLPGQTTRAEVYARYVARGFEFPALTHPSASVSSRAALMPGAQVMRGVAVQAGARIGENAIVNTGCAIDHDSIIGRHSHVAPGAVLCGGVSIGESVFVGSGATLINGVRVGDGAVVGAGAVVVGTVRSGAVVVGVPARERSDA